MNKFAIVEIVTEYLLDHLHFEVEADLLFDDFRVQYELFFGVGMAVAALVRS